MNSEAARWEKTPDRFNSSPKGHIGGFACIDCIKLSLTEFNMFCVPRLPIA